MAEPPTMFRIGVFSVNIQYCINNVGLCYLTVAPMWSKSYHNTGPQGTFLRHLVCAIGSCQKPWVGVASMII